MNNAANAGPHSIDPPSPTLQRLVERGRQHRYRKGTVIISEGERGDTLFVLLSGRAKAYSLDARDREVTYGIHEPGAMFGEMSLDGGPRSASVITLEPTLCAVITRQTLLEHIAEHPEFALELITRVIARARLATQSARNMALLDVYGRVAQLLDSLALPQPDGKRAIPERLTHAEIASRVGCSREMVSRLMKDLENGGYLSLQGQRIRLERNLPARW
jgi:CRP/FNR family transcriptional regulator, cyclic AMP receptor protein